MRKHEKAYVFMELKKKKIEDEDVSTHFSWKGIHELL